jgi:tetratricopeptide (TPR) repeat protein
MKAEHRKELMTNSLAHRLGDTIQSMKEGPSRGTLLLLIAVGLIVIVVLAWRYFANSAEEADSARWLKWDSLASPGQLKAFVEDADAQGHMQGRLARLEEARRALYDGLRELGSSGGRKEARENIQHAAELYDKLADEYADKPVLHQQVLMGAAKAHESLGETDRARDYYRQLSDKYGGTVLGKDAVAQLERLDQADRNGDLKELRDAFGEPGAPAAGGRP